MAKSITSLLIGAAIEDGSIGSLDDQIVRYVPELKGSAYDGVTIRDAIDMKSGVDRADGDQLKPGGNGARMREEILVRNLRSPAQEALFVRRKEAPGRRFDYSTLNTSVLGWVLEKATHRRLDDYTAAKLWTRLGTDSDGSWIVSGTAPDAGVFNGMGFNATLRDYGRLGMMMLNHGRVAGRQVVPARWVDESVAAPHLPTSVGAMHGYNHFWWLVPDSAAYMAIGLQGQYIYVDPTTRTVIVKLSYVPLDDHAAGAEAEAFFAATSRWRPRPV